MAGRSPVDSNFSGTKDTSTRLIESSSTIIQRTDLVIGRERAARNWRAIDWLSRVQIETKKSYRGSAEFAKRFRIHGLETGFSPVYIRCLMNEHLSSIWPCCFTAHVPCEEVLHSLQSGLGGAGYRALTRLDHHRSKHYARVGTVYTKSLYPRGSLELWLGRGRFLNPYLRGLILDLLRSEIKPKEKTWGVVRL
ncbi:hypothetical protein Salat_2982000 [Sesamum alatum]|uniref:Uncharacterized protein n=1 Tax=Sesamum alatum TaxID=300844 RepID=A0AAE1XJ02_9LAMI|nr:hypothetical protein Salat_2982000 [Sesamum alatum]